MMMKKYNTNFCTHINIYILPNLPNVSTPPQAKEDKEYNYITSQF